MIISKTFRIEVAHFLPMVPQGHKCRRLHGHSIVIKVSVAGFVGAASGWVIDYADITRAWQPIHDQLDHRCLNDIPGLSNPTSENLAVWIWKELAPVLHGLHRIVVHETCTSECEYQRDVFRPGLWPTDVDVTPGGEQK